MTNATPQRETRYAPAVEANLASFRRDPPLAASFPLTLANGVEVPQFDARCGTCQKVIDPAWVRGRVIESLPEVVRIEANAYCVPCEKLVHVDGRFRAVGTDGVQFEYPDDQGRWRVLEKAPVARPLQRLRNMLMGAQG